jgi:hypothetical protein
VHATGREEPGDRFTAWASKGIAGAVALRTNAARRIIFLFVFMFMMTAITAVPYNIHDNHPRSDIVFL